MCVISLTRYNYGKLLKNHRILHYIIRCDEVDIYPAHAVTAKEFKHESNEEPPLKNVLHTFVDRRHC